MIVQDLITLYRRKTLDTSAPYLWSDDEIIEYADDAQNEAARRAHLLLDSRSSTVVADVTAADPMVEISDLILHIRRARLTDTMMPLVRRSVRDMDQQLPGWEAILTPGVPQVYIPDYETGFIRLYPVPLLANTLSMTATRMPLRTLTSAEDELEIPTKYHRGLLDWMLFRGYSKADPETLDEKKAAIHEAAFIAEYGDKSGAVDERWAFEQYQDVGEL